MTSDIVLFTSDPQPTSGAVLELRLEAHDGRRGSLVVTKIRPDRSTISISIPARYMDDLAKALDAWRDAIATRSAEDAQRPALAPTPPRPIERSWARQGASSRRGEGR